MDDSVAGSTNGPSMLARLMASTTRRMFAELDDVRAGLDHGATKGASNESVVRKFLQSRLPRSIGVTNGQVVDSRGGISKELDAILYDRERTPMLFTSADEAHNTVPVEGVVGVVEVKTRLTKRDLDGVLENCRSVKKLMKEAYFASSVSSRYRVYGREWTALPVYYAVFSFESDGLYSAELNDRQKDVPLHERIDTLVALDRGTALNLQPDPTAPTYHPSPEPGTVLAEGPKEHALLLWYVMLASYVVQAKTAAITLLPYMQEELQVRSQVAGTTAKNIVSSLTAQVASSMGVERGLIERMIGRNNTIDDLYELLRSGELEVKDDGRDPRMKDLKERARSITLDEWQRDAADPKSLLGQMARDWAQR